MTTPRSVIDTPWLTPEEAAAYSRRGVRTVYRDLANGKLRGNQSGPRGHWTLHVEDVDAWVRGEFAEVPLPATARIRAS